MEIVENSERRIEITQNLGTGEILWLLVAILIGTILLATGSGMIFVEAADIFTPNWAEIQGWSGDRWHFGTGDDLFEWNADKGTPLSHFWSILLSLGWMGIGLIYFIYGATVFVFSRWHLVFDFESGQAVLARWGLFRLPDQTFAISDISADIDIGTGEDNEMFQTLSVTLRRSKGQPDANGWRPWDKTLFFATCTLDQALALNRLLQAVPGTARFLPVPPEAAPAS